MASAPHSEAPHHGDHHDDIVYPSTIPFILAHLACFAAIWTGVTWEAVAIAVAFYWLRMFAIGAGYHRYFSHRAYSTGRVFQFILAFLAQSTAQKSVLWWAAKHRHHHLFSDTEHDVHSPRQSGFLYSHVGWIFAEKHGDTDLVKVADFAKYPEILWLHKYELLPATVLALVAFLIGGWPGLVVGFFWSTVAVYHGTFCINSLAHVHGKKRYVTGDDSRNNWLLAFFTMGEGWHNNHHAYQSSVRQGFRWWELDPTYYILKMLSWVGIVWDLKTPPEAVLKNEQKLGSRVIDRAAEDLAASFNIEGITAKLSVALATTPSLADLKIRIAEAQTRAHEVLAGVPLPHLPTRDEILARASTMFVKTRSLDDIVERAHRMILEAVGARLAVAVA
ncbi:MAG TPA: acyl-CoA desaturase [Microvirga sp.]|jgi:stearoyl-CoA desaturase (delta-9 desaturase)|nr:acyl-CoA desaturase [Microvirga sp.]